MAMPRQLAEELRFADSYSRLPMLLGWFDQRPELRSQLYRELGAAWEVCDNIGEHHRKVVAMLDAATDEERASMMTAEERVELAKLPPVLTVFRGCYTFNRAGVSWSLSQEVAREFPFYNRYAHWRHGHVPLLLTGRVKRDRCVLKLGRREQEVIAPRVRRVALEVLAP